MGAGEGGHSSVILHSTCSEALTEVCSESFPLPL